MAVYGDDNVFLASCFDPRQERMILFELVIFGLMIRTIIFIGDTSNKKDPKNYIKK